MAKKRKAGSKGKSRGVDVMDAGLIGGGKRSKGRKGWYDPPIPTARAFKKVGM